MLYAILILDTHLTQWLSLFAFSSCGCCVHQTKVAYFSKASPLSRNLSSQRKWQAYMAKVSPFRPKEKKHEFDLHIKCCS